jgi:cholesterol oxidase
VIVVGTGYGGAVTALRLAEKGIPVTLLEMGQLWARPAADGKVFCSMLSPDARAMWRKTRTQAVVSKLFGLSTSLKVPFGAGVLDVLSNPGIDVYLGRGVGGGSLVNSAMAITPLREVIQSIMPAGFDVDDWYARHVPLARRTLGVTEMRQAYFETSAYERFARVARDNFARAGINSFLLPSHYDYAYMEREEAGAATRSTLAFEGIYGNNHGKQSLDKTYLASAMATGLVTLHTLQGVQRIEVDSAGHFSLTTQQYDESGQELGLRQWVCEHLFLAGGSMGTTEMLVRARETGTLPRLNAHVGTRWSSNGDIFVSRGNKLWNPTGGKQPTMATSGMAARDHRNQPVFAMHLPLPAAGLETWVSANIVMARTPELGTFRYDAASDRAVVDWQGKAAAPVASARSVLDRVNAANGTDYRTDLYAGGKAFADTSTYHPVGGCPLGLATDLYGRVKGYDRLYVMDGAMVPDGLVANPALTITALAERNVERLLRSDLSALVRA